MSSLKKQSRDLSKMFRETADELDEHFNNVNIVRAIGSSVELVGKAATSGGLHLAPMDDEANLVVAALGAVATFVGGVAAGGAEIVGDIIEKAAFAQMEQLWDAFRTELGDMLDPTLSQEEIARKIANTCHNGFERAKIAKEIVSLSRQRRSASPSKAMIRQAVSLESRELSVDILDLNVSDIVKFSEDISNETKSPVGCVLRNLADKLDNLFQK